MEVIVGLIIVGLIIYGIFKLIEWIFTHILAPVAPWILGGLAIAGVCVGLISAFKNYIIAIRDNWNPYDSYVDRGKNKQEYAVHRSYFFGPGFSQMSNIIRDTWSGIGESVEKVSEIRDKICDFVEAKVLHIIVVIHAWIFYIIALLTVGFLGGFLTGVLVLIHSVILLSVMIVCYILFSITWLVDRIYLQIKSIKTSCPYDQTRVVIPHFDCPCGRTHTKLVPGPYGIWHRRCVCGNLLPTTFLLGRSNLKARCPVCGHELASAGAQQFAITMVGGTASGKTVLLTAFYHQFLETLRKNPRMDYTIPEIHEDIFRDMDDWYGGELCPQTERGQTSTMYSVLLHSNVMDVEKQFAVYDIAGEAFDGDSLAEMLPQKAMKYSDGVVIVIDPLNATAMRSSAEKEGDDTMNYSQDDAATVISNFITYLKTMLGGGNLRTKSEKPVAVVITKTDLSSVSKRISYLRIKMTMANNPGKYADFPDARDKMSREFLIDIGLREAVQVVEASFQEIHYFPVSAMGHAPNGKEYEPIHVMEPFHWLIQRSDSALAELMGIAQDK